MKENTIAGAVRRFRSKIKPLGCGELKNVSVDYSEMMRFLEFIESKMNPKLNRKQYALKFHSETVPLISAGLFDTLEEAENKLNDMCLAYKPLWEIVSRNTTDWIVEKKFK